MVAWWRQHLRVGKGLVVGDFNFDPNDPPISDHQGSLNHLRALIDNMILNKNWAQLVKEITRSQKCQESACIDHVYVNQENFIEHLFRENVTGTDHYAVGVKVRLTDSVFESRSFLGRNLNKIPEGAFEKEFLNLRVHEVYQAETVDEAVERLERKMLTALNVVAPEKLIRTRENYAK